MNFYEIVANFIIRLVATGVTLLLMRAYFSALGFKVVKLDRFAIIAAVPLLCTALITSSFHINLLFIAAMMIVSKLIICYTIARGNKLLILVAGLFLILLFLISEIAALMTIDLLGLGVVADIPFAVLAVSFSLTFLIPVIAGIRKIAGDRDSFSPVEFRAVIPAILMIIGCGILATYTMDTFLGLVNFGVVRNNLDPTFLILALLFIVPAVVALYYSVLRQAKVKQQNSTYQQQLQFYDEYLQEKETDYKTQRVLKHDQDQHFNFVLSAIENNQPDAAAVYLKQLMQSTSSDKIKTGSNLAVGSVLSHKYESMKENQIELASLIEVPDRMEIDDVDVCVILGNLLDNAIEAVKQVSFDERIVDLQIRYDAGNLLIGIKNPYVNALKKGGLGGFASSKRGQGQHGLGLYSIRQALEKYDGILHIETDGDNFLATAVVYGNVEL